MAQVTIVINSREYAIACEDGQESRIIQLAEVLEEKAKMLNNISGQINENMLLAMIGILIADDLAEARKAFQAVETAKVANSTIAEADQLIAERLKIVVEEIKSIAKEIDLL
jgi:cell division protein ZapA